MEHDKKIYHKLVYATHFPSESNLQFRFEFRLQHNSVHPKQRAHSINSNFLKTKFNQCNTMNNFDHPQNDYIFVFACKLCEELLLLQSDIAYMAIDLGYVFAYEDDCKNIIFEGEFVMCAGCSMNVGVLLREQDPFNILGLMDMVRFDDDCLNVKLAHGVMMEPRNPPSSPELDI